MHPQILAPCDGPVIALFQEILHKSKLKLDFYVQFETKILKELLNVCLQSRFYFTPMYNVKNLAMQKQRNQSSFLLFWSKRTEALKIVCQITTLFFNLQSTACV